MDNKYDLFKLKLKKEKISILLIQISLVVILFSLYGFAVAFRIIDIFVRFGFILVLMPVFVAAAVFPATREFTKKAFTFLLKTITDFLALTLAIRIPSKSFLPRGSRSRSRARPRFSSRAPISRPLVRSQRSSAVTADLSLTRARVSAIRASIFCARPARRLASKTR